jgi:hypothetical protein
MQEPHHPPRVHDHPEIAEPGQQKRAGHKQFRQLPVNTGQSDEHTDTGDCRHQSDRLVDGITSQQEHMMQMLTVR